MSVGSRKNEKNFVLELTALVSFFQKQISLLSLSHSTPISLLLVLSQAEGVTGHTQRLDFNALKNQQSSPTVNSSTQPPQVSKPEPLEHFESLNFLSTLLISPIDHVWLQFSLSVMSDSMQPHGLQHVRLPCPSPTPGACSSTCPWSR